MLDLYICWAILATGDTIISKLTVLIGPTYVTWHVCRQPSITLVWLLDVSFQNDCHLSAAKAASTPLERLSRRCWYLATTTRTLVAAWRSRSECQVFISDYKMLANIFNTVRYSPNDDMTFDFFFCSKPFSEGHNHWWILTSPLKAGSRLQSDLC